MHALSKKLYYDVLKGGLEDTILESDSEDEDYEQGDTSRSTSEVGCFARIHTKSNAMQTQWSHNGKNFRHEFTNTSDAKFLKRPRASSRVFAIHRSVSYEDIAVSRVRGAQTTSSVVPKICSNKSVAVDFFDSQVDNISTTAHMPFSSRVDGCVNTECKKSDKCEETCICDDYDFVPCNKGFAACRNFTLGTAEFRRVQKENCKTKLIGGCRVPVCKNNKSRF